MAAAEVESSIQRLKLSHEVCVIKNTTQLPECFELESENVLSFDCEGVDLGRNGQVSIVQLGTKQKSFLFDVLDKSCSSDIILFLKSILENNSIIKIIHDCKMDSDALWYHFGISLSKCHDTQKWDSVLKNQEMNLNKTLSSYGCPTNEERDKNVYAINHQFWAIRPLTTSMIEWASGDVQSLFQLYEAQLHEAEMSPISSSIISQCEEKSEENINFLKLKCCGSAIIHKTQRGRFIGKGGSNIRALEQKGKYFYQFIGPKDGGTLNIYAKDENSLRIGLQTIQKYQSPQRNNNNRYGNYW